MRYLIALLLLASLNASAQKKLSQLPIVSPDTGMTFVVVNSIGGIATDVRVRLDSVISHVSDSSLTTLQRVTDNGNETTDSIGCAGLKLYDPTGGDFTTTIGTDNDVITFKHPGISGRNAALNLAAKSSYLSAVPYLIKSDYALQLPEIVVNADYNVTAADYIVINRKAGQTTKLPSTVGNEGRIIVLKNIQVNGAFNLVVGLQNSADFLQTSDTAVTVNGTITQAQDKMYCWVFFCIDNTWYIQSKTP